ncbi:hypothetical protein C8R42DRAFT_646339 [Lentinula raphanica]|nr:hypothetical protein C8R42DRAFT_646339 [Lentinula raphanica]
MCHAHICQHRTTPVLSAAKEDDEYDFELEEWIIGPFSVEYMSKDEKWLADHGPIDGYVGQKLNSEKDIKFKGKNNVSVYQFTGKKSKENYELVIKVLNEYETTFNRLVYSEVASLHKVGLYHGLGSVNGHLVIVIDKVKGKSLMLTEEWMTALDSRWLEMVEDIGGAVRELIIHLAMIEGIFLTMMYMKDEGNIYVVFNNDRTLKRVRLINFGPLLGIIVIKPGMSKEVMEEYLIKMMSPPKFEPKTKKKQKLKKQKPWFKKAMGHIALFVTDHKHRSFSQEEGTLMEVWYLPVTSA